MKMNYNIFIFFVLFRFRNTLANCRWWEIVWPNVRKKVIVFSIFGFAQLRNSPNWIFSVHIWLPIWQINGRVACLLRPPHGWFSFIFYTTNLSLFFAHDLWCAQNPFTFIIHQTADIIKTEASDRWRRANDSKLDFILIVTPSMESNKARQSTVVRWNAGMLGLGTTPAQPMRTLDGQQRFSARAWCRWKFTMHIAHTTFACSSFHHAYTRTYKLRINVGRSSKSGRRKTTMLCKFRGEIIFATKVVTTSAHTAQRNTTRHSTLWDMTGYTQNNHKMWSNFIYSCAKIELDCSHLCGTKHA